MLRDRKVVLYAPTFRGRGRAKHATAALDGRRLRSCLPPDDALVLKSHPNLDPSTQPVDGFDVVADPESDMNDCLALADVFVTDYSSSIFEWAILHRPLVLVVDDLEAYEEDPGLYLDYRREMIGTQVRDADGVAAAILADDFDLSGYDRFIAANIGAATATPRSASSTASCPATSAPTGGLNRPCRVTVGRTRGTRGIHPSTARSPGSSRGRRLERAAPGRGHRPRTRRRGSG